MLKPGLFLSSAALAVALGALSLAGIEAQSQTPAAATPDLGGTYQCKPNPDPCAWSGASATITQSGSKLTIKGENGALADASLTSPTTISAAGTFNSLGIVRPDHSIDWSDGTKWSRQ
jgi:hypothetical protein